MIPQLKILIVGGYGTFGGRLVELLEDESELCLIVSGRSLEKAEYFCASFQNAKARLQPAQFDRSGDLYSQLKILKPDMVFDASGPFQNYGDKTYDLVKACIDLKINYLDLADGSDFVDGIGQFDQMAKEAGVFVLSGVSSFPVLSASIVNMLSEGMKNIQTIEAGIAPSPYAGIGLNVLKAIAGYAGQEIDIHQGGHIDKAYPLTSSLRYTISPPGYLPLRNILFSLVDVPDLRVLATVRPEARRVWVGAGPVPEILHRMLNIFAWFVRWGFLKNLFPLAPLMDFVIRYIRWGEHRGGMFVEVSGEDEHGILIKKSWHLLAEGRDGPMIPSMAVEAIICRILQGGHVPPGARTALNDLSLEDYQKLFAQRTIYTGIREERPGQHMPLYRKILGQAFEKLPQPIKQLHELNKTGQHEGRADVKSGTNPLAKLIAKIFGFPNAGENIPVRVNFMDVSGIELWLRTFGDTSFTSYQYEGKGRSSCLLVERFGVCRFSLALVMKENRLYLITRRWSFLHIPMPLWLAPISDSYEFVEEGRFHFNVRISYPFIGLIVHYKGWLQPSP